MENPKILIFRNCVTGSGYFRSRFGRPVLAGVLEEYRGGPAVVLGIPAGGVAVAVEIARALTLPTGRCRGE